MHRPCIAAGGLRCPHPLPLLELLLLPLLELLLLAPPLPVLELLLLPPLPVLKSG
jgi:hypothetical protein